MHALKNSIHKFFILTFVSRFAQFFVHFQQSKKTCDIVGGGEGKNAGRNGRAVKIGM